MFDLKLRKSSTLKDRLCSDTNVSKAQIVKSNSIAKWETGLAVGGVRLTVWLRGPSRTLLS